MKMHAKMHKVKGEKIQDEKVEVFG